MSQNGTSLPLPARPNTACLAYSSGSSARAFAPRFFQTCPHASQPLRFAIPSTPSGFKEDLHLPVVEHARHGTAKQTGPGGGFPDRRGQLQGKLALISHDLFPLPFRGSHVLGVIVHQKRTKPTRELC